MARRTREQIRVDRARADREEARTAREGSNAARNQRRQQRSDQRESFRQARKVGRTLTGNPPAALVASGSVTLIALVAYDFLGPSGDGSGKLPDPRPIVATLAFWSLLGLVGSLNRTLSTGVAWVSWILTSTVLVQGARGKGLILYIQKLAKTVVPVNQSG